MSTIVTRLGKGSSLTWAEGDANFTNLNTDKYQAGDSPTFAAVTITTGALTGKLGGAYSNILGLGVTPTDWSNTILPVTGMQFGDRGAYYQYSGEVNFGFNVKVNSTYQDVAITGSGTPAKLKVGAGAVTMQTATTNPGAGSPITFTTIARADGGFVSGGSFVVDVGRVTFPATQNASTDVNTMDDYEEGTWTPIDTSGAGLGLLNASGTYIKIGRLVQVDYRADYPVTASGAVSSLGGLPFTTANTANQRSVGGAFTGESTLKNTLNNANSTNFTPRDSVGNGLTNATLSGDSIYGTIVYLSTN